MDLGAASHSKHLNQVEKIVSKGAEVVGKGLVLKEFIQHPLADFELYFTIIRDL